MCEDRDTECVCVCVMCPGELARYKELAEKLEIDQAETRIHLREATRVIDSMQALMQDNMRMKKQVCARMSLYACLCVAAAS